MYIPTETFWYTSQVDRKNLIYEFPCQTLFGTIILTPFLTGLFPSCEFINMYPFVLTSNKNRVLSEYSMNVDVEQKEKRKFTEDRKGVKGLKIF